MRGTALGKESAVPKTKRPYAPEFKEEAVRMVLSSDEE